MHICHEKPKQTWALDSLPNVSFLPQAQPGPECALGQQAPNLHCYCDYVAVFISAFNTLTGFTYNRDNRVHKVHETTSKPRAFTD